MAANSIAAETVKFSDIKYFPAAYIDKHIGSEVVVNGVVFKIKNLNAFAFVQVMHERAIVQCIYTGALPPEVKEGCAVEITGVVKEAAIKDAFISPNNCEIHISAMKVLSQPAEQMPFDITKKDLHLNPDTKFDFRMLSLRHPKERAIFRVQEGLVYGVRDFFERNNFAEIRTPKIVKAGAEGGANVFEIKYFDRAAYLAQSPQFYKEFGIGIFGRVFEIAPAFRGEKHSTSRHINEFISIDMEAAFINSFHDLMRYAAGMIESAFDYVEKNRAYELGLWKASLKKPGDVPSVRFRDAKNLVKQIAPDAACEDNDFSPAEEAALSGYAAKEWGSDFLFVTHYPTCKRPFYAKEDPADREVTLSFDLLYRGVEIITGGQRIHDYAEINDKMTRFGLNPADFEFFTTAHKHGLPPHGGFGMGLERITQKALGLDNVKFASMYPRDCIRITP